MKVLAEVVEHHIEEEVNEFLPDIEDDLGDRKKAAMSEQFLKLRAKSQRAPQEDNAGVLGDLH